MEENRNEVVTDTESFDGDVPAILPDGWQEGESLIPEGGAGTEGIVEADGLSDDAFLSALLKGGDQSEASAPTTGEAEADGTDAGAKTEAKPDGAGPAAAAPRKLTLKVNHEERDVDLSAMSDADLTALLQKGYAFDALKDAEDRRTFLNVYQEQIDAGMTETVARLVAKDATGGKTYEVTDGQIVETPEPVAQPAQANPRTAFTRDLRSEVEQLRLLYPDIKEMPDTVAKDVAKGVPLMDAYQKYQIEQSNKAAETLKKENKILRQNAANVQRAPVRGVTGGGAAPQKSDPFTAGFDAGWSWT